MEGINTDKCKGYQWPASALTVNEMEILSRLRTQEAMPITQLLKKAIIEFDENMTRKEIEI